MRSAVSLYRVRSGLPAGAPIYAGALLYVGYSLSTMPASPVMENDSVGYLAFSPIRNAGYSLFLWMLGARGAELAQPILYAFSAAFLCGRLSEVLPGSRRPVLAGFALLVLLCANPQVNAFHAKILTESIFCSILMVAMAAAMCYAGRARLGWLIVASICGGLAYAIRPTGIILLPALVMLVLMLRKSRRGTMLALAVAVISMLAVIAMERGYSHHLFGDKLESLLGRHVYAKSAVIDTPALDALPADPTERALTFGIDNRLQPIRDLLSAAPTVDIRTPLSVYYEHCVAWLCGDEIRKGTAVSVAAMDRAELAVGLARIGRAPLAYLGLVWTDYRAMWVVYSQSHPDLAGPFNAFLAAHQPLPFAADIPGLGAETPYRPAIVIRPAFLLIGFATGLLALVGVVLTWTGTASPFAASGCLGALIAHGGVLFTAAFAFALPRFILGLWPAIAVALVIGAILAWDWIGGVAGRAQAPRPPAGR